MRQVDRMTQTNVRIRLDRTDKLLDRLKEGIKSYKERRNSKA